MVLRFYWSIQPSFHLFIDSFFSSTILLAFDYFVLKRETRGWPPRVLYIRKLTWHEDIIWNSWLFLGFLIWEKFSNNYFSFFILWPGTCFLLMSKYMFWWPLTCSISSRAICFIFMHCLLMFPRSRFVIFSLLIFKFLIENFYLLKIFSMWFGF